MKTPASPKGGPRKSVVLVASVALLVGAALVILNLMPADRPGTKVPDTSAGAPAQPAAPAAAKPPVPAQPAAPQPAAAPVNPRRQGTETLGG